MTIILFISLFIIFLTCSAIFSGSETALFSLSRARLLSWEKDDLTSRRQASSLMKSYNRTLIALVLSNTFVNVGVSMTGDALFAFLSLSIWLSTLLAIVISIVLLLIFGEVTPKTLARLHPEYISQKVSGTVLFIRTALTPLIVVLEKIFSYILDIIGREESSPLNAKEYSSYIDIANTIGAFTIDESKLLGNIFALRESSVTIIMKSRVDLKTINIKDSQKKITKIIQQERELYYPVVSKDLDDSDSFLSARDFYLAHDKKRSEWIKKSTFPAIYIPEHTSLTKALTEMKKNNIPIALVVDEYGGVTGTIKLNDIYQELIGDINSEFEIPDWQIKKLSKGKWLLSGQITLEDITEMTGVEFNATPLNTLNGLFYEMEEKVPLEGESLKINNAIIEVLKVRNNRIIEAELMIVGKIK